VIVLYAADSRAYLAGKCKGATSLNNKNDSRAVNTGWDKDLHFSFMEESGNRVHWFQETIPGCMWSRDTWIIVSCDNLRSAGGQAQSQGCAISMVVANWRNPSTARRHDPKGILEQLIQHAKAGRNIRNQTDFSAIREQAKRWQVKIYDREIKAVNCLDIPAKGDCFPQSCRLNILTSANPKKAKSFYDPMFPSDLHFTSLPTYVMQDSLNGCTNFGLLDGFASNVICEIFWEKFVHMLFSLPGIRRKRPPQHAYLGFPESHCKHQCNGQGITVILVLHDSHYIFC